LLFFLITLLTLLKVSVSFRVELLFKKVGQTLGSTILLHLVVAFAMLPGGQPAGGQSQSSANTRSPHGSLSIPCQNCHTLSGWKPIRALPEFDHNTTKYPLRGLHEGVACTQCHTKMVFTNVGTQCADCHADIHKRQMGANCEQCHSVRGWHVSVQQINQHLNRFPLIGAHATVDCDSCHKSAAVGQFQGLSTQCFSCHQQDFINTKSIGIDHVALNLPTTCEQCHSMDNWVGAKFDHLKFTGFALTGAHATLDCSACHAGGKFMGAPATCVGCHLADFNKTNNPPHAQAGFPNTCQTCHNTTSWDQATFDHNTFTKFPLTGAHATVACTQCHINGQFVGTPTDCASCHMKDFNSTTNPNHVQSGFPTGCQQCHTTATWNNATFDHSSTGFPLTGAHSAVQCSQCHVNGNYNLTSANTTCVSCHLKDFQGTTQPNHVQSGFPQNCTQCHNTTTWMSATFDHSTTGFPLTGAHTTVACAQCHVNNNYTLSSANTACVSCHLKDFQGATQPNHVQSGFAQTCQQCHTTTSWTGASFDHSTTGFPLTGAHTTVQCAQCHVNGNYTLTSANTACASCHLKDFQGTTQPNHVQSGFPQTCQQCHSTTSWMSATFDHSTTGFPLTGAHTTLQCAQCHVNGNYNLTSANTACVSCHLKDFQGTTNPNHVSSGLPQTCQQCHTTTSWLNANFDHSTTGFPLTGFHTTVACASCHVNNNYNLTSANTACVSCHLADFNGTTNPSHVQSNFPQTCQQCHTTTSWGNATFDHSTTGFPLTGFHTTLQCTQCHVNGNYNLTAANTACVSCHLTDFNNTNNPPHASAGFPQACQTCHSTTNWTSATFNHATTGFALTGFHTSLTCAQCHVNNNYSLTSGACAQCHLKDYQGTTAPNHAQAGFPTACDQCHTTTNWGNGTFNHSTTGFALTGFHLTMTCAQCHVNGNYSLTAANTTCISCHQTDYNNTNAPPHATAGFPTTCDVCHSTTNWTGAVFNHNNTTFPLTGFHATAAVTCVMCHVNNNYTTLPTACVGCHQTDYNNTTNPNHKSAGFPTTCDTCHTTAAWTGAVFNHTWFNVNHGNANGVCATCHTNPSDYSVFQCTQCHGGGNAGNFQHPNVSGYVYNSVNCYQCHKGG
jgi:hypothetical protein